MEQNINIQNANLFIIYDQLDWKRELRICCQKEKRLKGDFDNFY